MSILALADDMTGALEIGAKFSAAGIRSLVSAKPVPLDSAPVVVFDTETRHSSPEFAQREIRRFVLDSGPARPRLIYKKTDSTLRGNISVELRALAELFPTWRIGYGPAYPALGRTVKDGVPYVDNVPVADTAFAHDALNPIHDSSVSAMFEPQFPCTIFDGATDADLIATAGAILSDEYMCIAAGPAGLAGTIAQQIDARRSAPPPLPPVRSCLIINGSLHQQSASQTRFAEAHGCTSPAWRILHKSYSSGTTSSDVARRNSEYVVEQMSASAPDAIFVIGGDTAFAVITALGLPTLSPIGEVLPGIPISRIDGAQHDLLLITKAGGFGATDALCRIRAILDD